MDHEPLETPEVVQGIGDTAESQYHNTTLVAPDPPRSENLMTGRATNGQSPRNMSSSATDSSRFHAAARSGGGEMASKASTPPENTQVTRFFTSQAEFFSMLGLLLLGVVAAIGHHVFYSYLNTENVDETAVTQTWAIRIGTAFAYLFKTALIAAEMFLIYCPSKLL